MLYHNFTMMNEDETADPVGTAILPSTTTMPSKRMTRTTGPRSFGRRMARVGTGLVLLLLVAEGGALWSDPVSSSPGRQRRGVGARVAEKAAAEEGVVMTENGHDTTTSRRDDVAAGAGAVVTAQDGSHLHEFPRRHETAEEDGIEMMEDGSRTHEFSTPRRVNIKNTKKTSQSLAVQLAVGCLADGTFCDGGSGGGCADCCNGHYVGASVGATVGASILAHCGKKPQTGCTEDGFCCEFGDCITCCSGLYTVDTSCSRCGARCGIPCWNCANKEPCCRDGGEFDFSCPGCSNGRI